MHAKILGAGAPSVSGAGEMVSSNVEKVLAGYLPADRDGSMSMLGGDDSELCQLRIRSMGHCVLDSDRTLAAANADCAV